MARYRVLIVDDQHDVRRVLSAGLATLPLNIDVVDVPSAEEAMLVAHSSYDLMISDVRLPGISGLVLVSRVQKLHPSMKIMLMTGLTDPKIRQEVESAGAEAFFYKPINLDQFLSEVERLLTSLPSDEPDERNAAQSKSATPKPLSLVDLLEDLRRKAVMGLAAILAQDGKVISEAGFLQGGYLQEGLRAAFTRLYTAGVELSSQLNHSEPDNLFYIAGRKYHFYVASINPSHFLLLASEQPFQQHLDQLNQLLALTIRRLEQVLDNERSDRSSLAEIEPESGAQTPVAAEAADLVAQLSFEEELVDVEISQEEREAVDALFDQASLKKVKHTDLDEFWENLAEKSGSQQAGEGAISYDDALDMGLAPE